MELLLLLSAFLTALTGAITGVRATPSAAQEQTVAGAERAVVAAVAARPVRPMQGWATLASLLQAPERVLPAAFGLPVFGQRRRE